jgi:hypothetical protein
MRGDMADDRRSAIENRIREIYDRATVAIADLRERRMDVLRAFSQRADEIRLAEEQRKLKGL